MSQKAVETLLGRILTDEGFRATFFPLDAASFDLAAAQGFDLTPVERDALATLDRGRFEPLARGLDSRICRTHAGEAMGGDRGKRNL
jgi:hypothetical protein